VSADTGLCSEIKLLYARDGQARACVLRVERLQAMRHHIRLGAALPLHVGAPGRVILAFSGELGEPYEGIRKRGFHWSIGERDPQVASVAAPVLDATGRVHGSMCISGPSARLGKARLLALAPVLLQATRQLSQAFLPQRPRGSSLAA
jgi:DNA-binding IclR family transcriptional regulator